MVHLLDSIELNCGCTRAAAHRRGYEFILLNKSVQGHSARPNPCYFSLKKSHCWNGCLPLSSIYTASALKHAIPTETYKPVLPAVKRSFKLSASIGRRTHGGINFFRKSQPRNDRPGFSLLVIRSVLYFASKQNFLIDFVLNNWSDYERNVLQTDSDGGQGGGFTFLRGLGGGGEGHYSSNGRKSAKIWWWVLWATSFLGWVYVLGIYWGIVHPPNFCFDVGRFKEMIGALGSWGLSTLILLCIVGAMAIAGSILVGSLRSLSRNLRITVFPSRRKTHNLALAKSLGAGTLLSAVGLCLFLPRPLLPGALWKKTFTGLTQLNQIVDNSVKAALMVLNIHFINIHSLCQKRVVALLDSVTSTTKARNRRK